MRQRQQVIAQRAIAPALAAGLVADAIGFAELFDANSEICHGACLDAIDVQKTIRTVVTTSVVQPT